MFSLPKVFGSEKNLEEPFVPVRRVDVTKTGLGSYLRKLVYDYCIKKGKPLVLTGFEQLINWDADVFDIECPQELKENETEVYNQINDSSRATVTCKDQVTKLQEDSIQTAKDMNFNNNTDKNSNNKNVNNYSIQKNDDTYNVNSKDESTVQIEQVEQTQRKENAPDYHSTIDKVKACFSSKTEKEKVNTEKEQQNEFTLDNNDDTKKNNNDNNDKVDTKKSNNYDGDIQHRHGDEVNKSSLHKNNLYYGNDLDFPVLCLEKMKQHVPNYLKPFGNDDLTTFLPKHLQTDDLSCCVSLRDSKSSTPFHCGISGSLSHSLMVCADQDAFAHWLIIDKADTEKLRHVVKESDIPRKSCFDENSYTEIIYNDKVPKNKRDHDDIEQNEEDETSEEFKTKRHHVDVEVPNSEEHNEDVEVIKIESNIKDSHEGGEDKDKAFDKKRQHEDSEKNNDEPNAKRHHQGVKDKYIICNKKRNHEDFKENNEEPNSKRHHGDNKENDYFISSITTTTNSDSIANNEDSSVIINENESSSIIPSPITIVTNKEYNNENPALPIQEEASSSILPTISSISSSLSTSNSLNDLVKTINDNDDEHTIKQQKVTTFDSSEGSSTKIDDTKTNDNITMNQEKCHFKNTKSKPFNALDIKQEESISDIYQKKSTFFLDSESAIVTINQLKDNNINTHVVTQKPGDLVIIPSACYHQVTAIGDNYEASWIRITADSLREGITKQLPIYQLIGRPETYRCSATIYHTLRKFAYNNNLTIPKVDQDYFKQSYQSLIDMYYKYVISNEIVETIINKKVSENEIINDIKELKKMDPETQAFDKICGFCKANIFLRYYHCDECQADLCLHCYAFGRTCKHPLFLSMHQTTALSFHFCCQLYFDSIRKMKDMFGSDSVQSNVTTFETNNQPIYPLATICRRLEMHRKKNKMLCHQFRCIHCLKRFCLCKLQSEYKTNIFHILKRRPCTSRLSNALQKHGKDLIFSCMDCSKKSSCCSLLDTFNEEISGDMVFYFNDLVRKDDWYGGSYDPLLLQSACWPFNGVMDMNHTEHQDFFDFIRE